MEVAWDIYNKQCENTFYDRENENSLRDFEKSVITEILINMAPCNSR